MILRLVNLLINITAILTFAIFHKPSEHFGNAERVLCLEGFLKEKPTFFRNVWF